MPNAAGTSNGSVSSNGHGKNGTSELDYERESQHRLRPQDNYSTIAACSHLKSVLESSARETALITYRQAVNISRPIDNDLIYTAKKDGSVVSHHRLLVRKSSSLRCTDCSLNNFHHNFTCLQCPHVGCFNDVHNHAYTHYKLTQHVFAIDSHSGLLYCFPCGTYVNHPALDKVRQEVLLSATDYSDLIKSEVDEEFDYSDVDAHYSDPSRLGVDGLKGFVNLGATCFMSSILQTFIHNPIIKNHFFNNDLHYFNCEKSMAQGSTLDENNACITCSIDNIFQLFYTSNSIEGFGMTNLLTTAWYKKKSLAGFQEQDAHEFWQFILNEFHSDYERIRSNTGLSPMSTSDCNCITHSTFSGELQSSIRCLSCESVTKTIDPMVDLSLEINHLKLNHPGSQIDLYDCLDLFTSDEKLDVMYTCQSCGDKTKAIKSLSVKSLPPVLSIQLKRFKHNSLNDTSSKIETPIKIPLYLNMTRYSIGHDPHDSEQIDEDKIFELFALVCHIGSVNTGHYIVLTKDGNGQWFKFDDSVVSMVSQEEVTNTNAYLVFYITHKI